MTLDGFPVSTFATRTSRTVYFDLRHLDRGSALYVLHALADRHDGTKTTRMTSNVARVDVVETSGFRRVFSAAVALAKVGTEPDAIFEICPITSPNPSTPSPSPPSARSSAPSSST